MVYLLNMVIFHGYVKQPDGTAWCNPSEDEHSGLRIWRNVTWLIRLARQVQHATTLHHRTCLPQSPSDLGFDSTNLTFFWMNRVELCCRFAHFARPKAKSTIKATPELLFHLDASFESSHRLDGCMNIYIYIINNYAYIYIYIYLKHDTKTWSTTGT